MMTFILTFPKKGLSLNFPSSEIPSFTLSSRRWYPHSSSHLSHLLILCEFVSWPPHNQSINSRPSGTFVTVPLLPVPQGLVRHLRREELSEHESVSLWESPTSAEKFPRIHCGRSGPWAPGALWLQYADHTLALSTAWTPCEAGSLLEEIWAFDLLPSCLWISQRVTFWYRQQWWL